MFTSEILTKIFAHPAIMSLPLKIQSDVVHAIEDVLDEEENDNADESVSDNVSTGISAE